MKKYLSQLVAYLAGPAFSYLFHLGIVAVVAWGVNHGFHLSLPVIPTSLTTFAALGFIKVALTNLGRAWHSGRLVAELEHDAGTLGHDVFSQLIAAAEGKDAA